MKQILLNYLPPADVYTPSASLSILKSFMLENNFETEIKYWNFLFNPILPFGESEETNEVIFPFISLINDMYNNEIGNSRVLELYELLIDKSKPVEELQLQLSVIKENINSIIETELQKLDFNNILLIGFTSKFHQWIPAVVVSKAIKEIAPNAKIIIGGFGSKEAAMEVMKMNPYFDFATWGEGEYPLLELSKHLNNETFDYNSVARLVYREQSQINISTTNRSSYIDFHNYPFPKFDDYFINYPEPDKKYKIVIPINSSRACSWNKCKFCDYNSGYKFRVRSPENIVQEIEYIARNYKSVCFSFVDNDIFINASHFERLLDLMIASKLKNNYDYEFWAEMIPNEDLSAELIKKMQTAGFTQIFIGYDGVSDSLLSKMQKSNNFSNNIFFVKFAQKYEIDPLVNIIIGLIDETESDIQEGMDNLHFLRFFYNKGEDSLYHDYVTLVISRMSKYYSMISEDEKEKYNINNITYLLPTQFSNHKDRFNLFSWNKNKITNHNKWEEMQEKDKSYSENTYTYKLIKNNRNITYKEYLNNKEVANFDFTNELYWNILKLANNKVIKIDELYSQLINLHTTITHQELRAALLKLKSMHIIYCDKEFSNIIGVVDAT
ncbi:MAG: hypothetical protein DRI86_09995 [Bacteroidetes bacterium]|nr:MAG: hypothetical protein DRI86_09995 [Bacteroidota bacterium]